MTIYTKALFAAICVASLTATYASCPNQCSGHGRCNSFDKCECYKQQGTANGLRYGWGGPDCSQRTCPLGVAFDQISTRPREVDFIAFDAQKKFDGSDANTNSRASLHVDVHDYKFTESQTVLVRVLEVDTTAGTVAIQWKLKQHGSFSQPYVLTYPGNDETDDMTILDSIELPSHEGSGNSGVRVFFSAAIGGGAQVYIDENHLYTFTVDYQSGKPYLKGDPNSAHQEIECSGRGSCDISTGRCKCFNGYTGEACQRTECANQCSGHGVCQDLKRFVNDVTDRTGYSFAYDEAYDATKEMGCLCDAGYRGADCSAKECPSGADPLGGAGGAGLNAKDEVSIAADCSGRGKCDYATGTCSCFKGFYGERCESQTTFV